MTGAAVDLSFRLFRRLFPLRPLDPSETPLTDEERRIYRRWEVWGLLPLFLFTSVFGCMYYFALKWAAGYFPEEVPKTLFLLRVNPAVWFVPAMLLGILTSAIPTNLLYFVLLGTRYRRFDRFCSERVGFDGDRALALLAILVVVGTLALFAIMTRSFARFTDSGIEIGRVVPPGRTFYGYERVRSVEHRLTFRAPIGKLVHRPHYVIVFDDDSAWYSNNEVHNPPPELAARIAQAVAQRSSRKIAVMP